MPFSENTSLYEARSLAAPVQNEDNPHPFPHLQSPSPKLPKPQTTLLQYP